MPLQLFFKTIILDLSLYTPQKQILEKSWFPGKLVITVKNTVTILYVTSYVHFSEIIFNFIWFSL